MILILYVRSNVDGPIIALPSGNPNDPWNYFVYKTLGRYIKRKYGLIYNFKRFRFANSCYARKNDLNRIFRYCYAHKIKRPL